MAATATDIVSLDEIKFELRFDSTDDGSQDDMLTAQIEAAVSFVSREISRPLLDEADEVPPALRQAVILCVRQFYDGHPEIRPTAAFYALIAPWRRYA